LSARQEQTFKDAPHHDYGGCKRRDMNAALCFTPATF
jgi:hypothetical protein